MSNETANKTTGPAGGECPTSTLAFVKVSWRRAPPPRRGAALRGGERAKNRNDTPSIPQQYTTPATAGRIAAETIERPRSAVRTTGTDLCNMTARAAFRRRVLRTEWARPHFRQAGCGMEFTLSVTSVHSPPKTASKRRICKYCGACSGIPTPSSPLPKDDGHYVRMAARKNVQAHNHQQSRRQT